MEGEYSHPESTGMSGGINHIADNCIHKIRTEDLMCNGEFSNLRTLSCVKGVAPKRTKREGFPAIPQKTDGLRPYRGS